MTTTDSTTSAPAISDHQHRGSISPALVITLIVVAAAGLSAILLAGPTRGAGAGERIDVFTVQEGQFDITLPASGEILAQRQLEVRNELEVGAVITEIVEEGLIVSAGEVLMQLNDETIREQIREQQTIVSDAENAVAASTANLAIRKSEAESQLETADLTIRLAALSLEAWREGQVQSTRQDLELSLATAEKNYDRIVARFEASKNLLEKEFISLDEYRGNEIAMIEAKARLEQSKLAITVYEDYQHFRDKADLESRLAQARDDRERLGLVTASQIDSATSEVESRQFALENAQARLDKLERQLEACTVTAPTDGLVVYASSIESGNMWSQEEDPPQIGTQLSRNQLVMLLPDTTRMVAEVKVSEALSGLIEPGQRAAVTTEAAGDRIFPGVVQSVGVMAQSMGGMRGPNRRDYTVRILLDGNGNSLGLKPSLRCKSHIYVGTVESSKFVPVHAIHYAGGVTFVFVEQGDGYIARPVTVGQASEMYIQVTEGLEVGERVLLRQPQSNEIIGELPQSILDTQMTEGDDEARPADPMDAAGAERRLENASAPGQRSGTSQQGSRRGGFELPEGVTMEQLREWGQVYRETGEWPAEAPDEIRRMAERMGGGERPSRDDDRDEASEADEAPPSPPTIDTP